MPLGQISNSYSCISCGASFKRSGNLASHQTQATNCKWVIEQRKQVEAAEMPDYREISDQEDDPELLSDLDFELSAPLNYMDMTPDDFFDMPNEESDVLYATGNQNQCARVEHAPDLDDDEDTCLHDPQD